MFILKITDLNDNILQESLYLVDLSILIPFGTREDSISSKRNTEDESFKITKLYHSFGISHHVQK